MAASPSQERINAHIRRALQKLAREFGGTYGKFLAVGTYNGIHWTAKYHTLRASNGEVACHAVYEANGLTSTTWEGFEDFLRRAA